jgi:NAD(P)-dependent dehydrogenase (short-subunit alcohol dehydrogenase family)
MASDMASDVTPDMTGKVCVVTGANSGIGKQTALALARAGAHVVLVSRNQNKGMAALDEIRRGTGSTEIDLLVADMSSFASVRKLASQIRRDYSRLDVLVNNAGAALGKRTLSADGIEMTVAGNHLGPLLLTLLLMDLLKASAPARVVNVSSEAQRRTRIDMSDPQFERRKFRGFPAYGQSKLMMNICTFELARRLEGSGVTVNCLHPGVVATNIAGGSVITKVMWVVFSPFMLNSKDGAAVSIYLASAPEVAGVTGKYFVKCKPAESNPLSYDPQIAREVWQWSLKMIGAEFS